MTSVSSAKSPPLGAPSSLPSSRRGSDTQRILTAFALGRPEPYGKIPLRRPSGSRLGLLAQSSTSPPDVSLSGIEGFDYDESWSLGIHPFVMPKKGGAKETSSDFGDVSYPTSPTDVNDEERQGRTGKTVSRASTISSRRSSRESGRRPSLLQQSSSPPIATSQSVSVTSKASSSPRTSKSLAEKSGSSIIPSLYGVSRGRSANVKLGGNWVERRGTSASVLLIDNDSDQRSRVVDGKRRESKLGDEAEGFHKVKSRRRRQRESSEGTDSALFSSDDDFSISSEEEEAEADVASGATSRRSSIEKDRRRGLKILLTPSVTRQVTNDEVIIGSTSLSSRDEGSALQDGKSNLSSPPEVSLFTDEEADSDISRSALLNRRRSSSGKRLLGSSLRSNSSSHRASTRLEVIFAGLTPDGLSDPPPSLIPMKSKEPVDIDADPLLSSAIGSVSDLIDVDAVVWNDGRSSNSTIQATMSKKEKKQTVEEQEKERRVGFAAAYQNRLASLLWSSKGPSSGNVAKTEVEPVLNGTTTPAESNTATSGDGESLLTSSWKRLIQLPNLLLMPTLGPSRISALQSEGIKEETKRTEGLTGTDEALAAQLLSMPPSPGPSVILPPSPLLSPNEAKQVQGRGVMNPLEGDTDVSAYVSGLGLPIDPDLELSSVVHLQTFRTTQKPYGGTPSRSRKGSLERPASGDAQVHRRAYSDNKMETPLPSLKLDKKLSDGSRKTSQELEEAKVEAEERRKKQSRSSSRGCSRPAVQAPVPGNFSAYNSSESEGEEMTSSGDESRSRQSNNNKRGRTSGGRRRSCSPPMPNRKQCAIGLFESRAHSRSRTSEIELAAEKAAAHMMRVRSTPNLPSLVATREKRQDRSRRGDASAGRGRAGSVKVVSASIAGEEEAMQEDVKAITALPNLIPIPPVSLYPSSMPPSKSPLGLGLPSTHGEMAAVRPSMVSNGAHLLMLSLELEMMRHRKITCSLKPRWLKARVRSESGIHRVGGDDSIAAGRERSNPRIFSHAHARPKQGSSLRFEVV